MQFHFTSHSERHFRRIKAYIMYNFYQDLRRMMPNRSLPPCLHSPQVYGMPNFLGLPTEIRHRIYRLLKDTVIIFECPTMRIKKDPWAFSLVSRQVYRETKPIFDFHRYKIRFVIPRGDANSFWRSCDLAIFALRYVLSLLHLVIHFTSCLHRPAAPLRNNEKSSGYGDEAPPMKNRRIGAADSHQIRPALLKSEPLTTKPSHTETTP